MRIALVSPYDLDVVGGVQSHVSALATALRDLGDDVLVVGPGDPGRPEDGEDPAVVRVGRSSSVPANGSRAPIALAPGAVRRVRRALARFRPDVVQVHEPLVPMVGLAAALGAPWPTVLTFHAAAERGPLPVLIRLARPLGRSAVARSSALTAVSAHAVALHSQALGIDRSRFAVVPNGVDVARFAVPRRSDRARPTLLFVGRLEARKGADLALEAFAALAAPRPTLRLRLVGAGPLESALRRRIAALPADTAARVDLLGRVPQARLPELLADADVALVPSRGGESFGIVLLEMMAAGTPLVAADLPAYRDVARHDREALLVPRGDATALAAAAARLLDETATASRLVAAGRERSAAFAWPRVAGQVRRVLAAAADGRPPSVGRMDPPG